MAATATAARTGVVVDAVDGARQSGGEAGGENEDGHDLFVCLCVFVCCWWGCLGGMGISEIIHAHAHAHARGRGRRSTPPKKVKAPMHDVNNNKTHLVKIPHGRAVREMIRGPPYIYTHICTQIVYACII